MYQLNTGNGYIIGLVKGVDKGNLSKDEYNELKSILEKRPTAPAGYGYRLKTDLQWELYEMPEIVVDESEIEATTEDYINALAELGVVVNV